MFINGTLVNNGTISMTARDSIGEGRYVSIDTNLSNPNVRFDVKNVFSNFFEWIGNTTGVPAANTVRNGGSYKCCGSGGLGGLTRSAAGKNYTNRIGGNGTSFSGGTGCGGIMLESNEAGQQSNVRGNINGGAGGIGTASGGTLVLLDQQVVQVIQEVKQVKIEGLVIVLY